LGSGNRKKIWIGISVLILCAVLAGTYVFEKMTDRMLAQFSTDMILALAPEHEIVISKESLVDSETETPEDHLNAEMPADPLKPVVKPKVQSTTDSNQPETPDTVPLSTDTAVVQVKVDPAEFTLAEKAKAYTLAAKRLSPAEMNNLLQWSQGGFTITEKQQAQALFNQNFTPDEQAWILDMFRKYND
jgi:hypothetical protein